MNFNRRNVTNEFQRKPRTLKELDRWKATELRQFLLYTGPFILKKVLSPERYSNFLKLSLAFTILLDTNDSKINNSCAKELLKSFVCEIPILYDLCFLTYNFHNLLHIHEDAKLHGSLDGISAFKFENHLQKVKRKVRKAGGVATQIYKRCVESSYHIKKEDNYKQPKIFRKIKDGKILNIKTNGFLFSLRYPNNYCLVENKIVKITEINISQNVPLFSGTEITNLTAAFLQPIDSTYFNIYWAADIAFGTKIEFNINQINKKVLCLRDSLDNSYFFKPLLKNVAE